MSTTTTPMNTHATTHPEVALTPEAIALIAELGLRDVSSRNDTAPSFEHGNGAILMVGDPDADSEWTSLNGPVRYLVICEDVEGYAGNDLDQARRSLLGEV
jgi:hypothetical protein